MRYTPKRATFTGTPLLTYRRRVNWVAVFTGATGLLVLAGLGLFVSVIA